MSGERFVDRRHRTSVRVAVMTVGIGERHIGRSTQIDRRTFLKVAGLGTIGAFGADSVFARSSAAQPALSPAADSIADLAFQLRRRTAVAGGGDTGRTGRTSGRARTQEA
jgi:hypothetical protein